MASQLFLKLLKYYWLPFVHKNFVFSEMFFMFASIRQNNLLNSLTGLGWTISIATPVFDSQVGGGVYVE